MLGKRKELFLERVSENVVSDRVVVPNGGEEKEEEMGFCSWACSMCATFSKQFAPI